jgi:ketosteroid isomerase-like protein
MGKAREVADSVTSAIVTGDWEALKGLYAPEAVLVDPLAGEVTGDAVIEVFRSFADAFSEPGFEPIAGHESGNVAVDEGYLIGVNTGQLPLPSGDAAAPTGRSIRVRSCDVMTVEDGKVVRHNFYYDQLELLTQLGLVPERASV